MIDLISIHIPKTAGRSFLSVLNSVYNTNCIAHFDKKNYLRKDASAIEQFKSQLNENVNVIHGHYLFSEIRDLKNKNSSKIITWLRNPVDRVISNYSFFKKRISESLHDDELQNRKDESLVEYASLENSRNRMSKFTEGLAIADFYFIGVTEHFDSEIKSLGEMLHWNAFDIPRINDNSEFKSKMPAVTDDEKTNIEKLNRSDVELYQLALEIRNKRMN